MLWNLRIPLARKLALAALFGSGIFIIICTILRTYYVLGDSSNQYLAQLWASREGFVSMIVVSAPGIWPFFSKMGWFGSPQKQSYQSGSGIPGSSRRWMSSNNRSGGSRDPDGGYELTCRSKRNAEGLGDGESEEHIIGTNRTSKADEARDGMPIRVTTEYTIRVEREAPHQLPSREAVVRERVLGWSKNAL